MSVITLISDWGRSDYYLSAVKGQIIQSCPNANIIDVNHHVQSFNVPEASFILRNCYKNFPKGTVHLVAVNAECSEQNPYVAIEYDGHYFVGTDNGIFGLTFTEKPTQIIKIEKDLPKNTTFPALDIFAKVAGSLASGVKITSFGSLQEELFSQTRILPTTDESVINGSVIYIDSYRNAVTNVSEELFDRVGKGRSFEIFVQSNHYKISKINKTYKETTIGELLAVFNSLDLLEVAINMGQAAQLMQLKLGSAIRVKFYEL